MFITEAVELFRPTRLYLIVPITDVGQVQCDLTSRFICQYLAIYNIENLPNTKKQVSKKGWIFAKKPQKNTQ